MEISIPNTASFFTQKVINNTMQWSHYCFRHAVLRAINGENINVQLEDAYMAGCDDCKDERDRI